jgi:hypothetical protein
MLTATSRLAFKVGKWTSDANFTLSICVSLISVVLSRIWNNLSTSRSDLFSCTDKRYHTNHKVMTLPMDCYLDVVGVLVPLRCEEGTPKAVRDKAAGKANSKITELKQFR